MGIDVDSRESKMGKFLLIIIFIFLVGTGQCPVPTAYGLRPSYEKEYSESSVNEEVAEIAQEKERIMEGVAPLREEREKNLHPFVQPVVVGEGFKPSPTTENVRLGYIQPTQLEGTRERLRPLPAENETPIVKYPDRNPEHRRGINFTFLSLIALAFLLSHFFIRPKSS